MVTELQVFVLVRVIVRLWVLHLYELSSYDGTKEERTATAGITGWMS